jgi:hypothetical protein
VSELDGQSRGCFLMTNDKHPEGFYSRYLRILGERRVAEGKPPAPDVCPPEYWQRRRELEELKK